MAFRAYTLASCVLLASPIVYATTIDLTPLPGPGNPPLTLGGTATTLGGSFLVSQTSHQSTGTGVIDSFLRIQQNGQERGYNTDAQKPPFDDLAGNFTHSLLLSEIPIVTIGGTQYREFLLDVDQEKSKPYLSLNQIQIFLSNGDATDTGLTEAADNTDAVITFGSGVKEIFRLNDGDLAVNDPGRTEIWLNYALNSGSGSGDMFLYIPEADFTGGYSNVILFSQFGNPRGTFSSNDGFEEWAVMTPSTTTEVPEPASIVLLGTLLCAFGTLLKRRTA